MYILLTIYTLALHYTIIKISHDYMPPPPPINHQTVVVMIICSPNSQNIAAMIISPPPPQQPKCCWRDSFEWNLLQLLGNNIVQHIRKEYKLCLLKSQYLENLTLFPDWKIIGARTSKITVNFLIFITSINENRVSVLKSPKCVLLLHSNVLHILRF